MKDWQAGSQCLYTLVTYSIRFADFIPGMKYAQQGVSFVEAHKLLNVWKFYGGMGMIAGSTKDHGTSLRFLKKAYYLQAKDPIATTKERANLRLNLALAFSAVDQQDSTILYITKALPYYQKLGDQRGIAYLYGFKGEAYLESKPQTAATLDSAVSYLNRKLQLMLQSNYVTQAVGTAIELTRAYRRQGKPVDSQKAAELALKLASHMPQERAFALEALAWAYADQGRYTVSYKYADRADALRDSLFNSEKAQSLAELQVQFDVAQQQQRLKLLAEQNRVVTAQNRVVEAQAQAERSRVSLLTQLNRVSTARQEVQYTSLKLLQQQKKVAEAQAQAQRSNVELLRQQNRVTTAQQTEQRIRQKALVVVLSVLVLGLLAGGLFYWRLRRQSTLLARANQTNSRSAAEKEVLLQEIQHRVKNNLQLMSSLLSWQSSTLSDPALIDVLASSQARIQSMAMVHDFLYRADNLAEVRLDTYLSELLDSLHQSLTTAQRPIRLTMDLAPLVMAAKEADYFGLLVNELVINAYKHAFSQQSQGHLHVSLASHPRGFQLRVIDNGVGLPAAGVDSKPQSIGMQLVRTIAKQLKATVTATAHHPNGTCMQISRG